MQQFINGRRDAGCGTSLMRTTMIVLRMVIKQAMVEERISRNVAADISVPKPLSKREDPRRLSLAEVQALLKCAEEDRLYGIYFVLANFGLRRGEALGIRVEDVDLDAASLHVGQQIVRQTGRGLVAQQTKTDHEHNFALTRTSLAVLRERLATRETETALAGSAWEESGLVFTTPLGTPIDPAFLNNHMRQLCKDAGIPHAAPHSLRRAFADIAHANGLPDKNIQGALGHKSISMTQNTYIATPDSTSPEFFGDDDHRFPDSARAQGGAR